MPRQPELILLSAFPDFPTSVVYIFGGQASLKHRELCTTSRNNNIDRCCSMLSRDNASNVLLVYLRVSERDRAEKLFISGLAGLIMLVMGNAKGLRLLQ